MKLSAVLIVSVMLFSCEEELAPTNVSVDEVDVNAQLEYIGSFENGPYGKVSGFAEIFRNPDNSLVVRLSSFITSNGPDLHVYLSKEAMPINFINLGELKSTNGTLVYNVPDTDTVDLATYSFVCIHCKEYNHLFGFAKTADVVN